MFFDGHDFYGLTFMVACAPCNTNLADSLANKALGVFVSYMADIFSTVESV